MLDRKPLIESATNADFDEIAKEFIDEEVEEIALITKLEKKR